MEYIKIFLTKFIFISIIIYSIFRIDYKILDFDSFSDMLPKTNLLGTNIPTLKEIFESRQLFINNKNITKEYINYIRSMDKFEEKKISINYQKKILLNIFLQILPIEMI